MPDADLQRFENGLNQTGSGLRLRLAMHEGRIALSQIERLRQLGGPRMGPAIETWRRAWIRSCDNASKALDQLWDDHQWPTDGGRDRRFEWRATNRSKR